MSKFEPGNILVSNTEPPIIVMVTDGPQSMFTFSSVVLVEDDDNIIGNHSKYKLNGTKLWTLLDIDIRDLAIVNIEKGD